MNEYPVIKVRGGKIKVGDEVYRGKKVIEKMEEMIADHELVYVIDLDGCKKNSPNLELYKKVDGGIWLDACPRGVEDVMDLIVAGAEKITIWGMKEEYFKEISEAVERDIFIGGKDVRWATEMVRKYNFRGIVIEEKQESISKIETWKIFESQGFIRRVK